MFAEDALGPREEAGEQQVCIRPLLSLATMAEVWRGS